MSQLNYIILFFLLLFLFSCKNNDKSYNSKQGNTKECENINNLRKKCKIFNSNGNIVAIEYYWKNKLKKREEYYRNGTLKTEGSYLDGIKVGTWNHYTKKAKLYRKMFYKKIGDTSYLNEYITYNEDGRPIIEESNYFEIGTVDDTIEAGDFFKMKIFLRAPHFDDGDAYLIVGTNLSIDSNYVVFNNSLVDTMPYIENNMLGFKTSLQKKGKFEVRGILIEYKDSNNFTFERRQYFNVDFFVK